MSKKSFKHEPALQFISSAPDVTESESSENPSDSVSSIKATAPLALKINNHVYLETKSKRFNMLIRPTLFEQLQGMAKERNTSVNELIHSILDAFVESQPRNHSRGVSKGEE